FLVALQKLLVKHIVVEGAYTLEVTWYNHENVERTHRCFTITTRQYALNYSIKPAWQHVANVTADSRRR
uniref:WIF domain-containing protein n=1 Tax=Mesocestoides corti TaxID=53468 RepID=A0A5K3G2M6_MESCO